VESRCQIDMAEACGSRTQILDSQLAANDLCRRLAAQVSQFSNVGSIPIARSITHDLSIALTRLTYLNPA